LAIKWVYVWALATQRYPASTDKLPTGRHGREESTIVLPKTDIKEAFTMCERILNTASLRTVIINNHNTCHIVNIGIAPFNNDSKL
jgi:GGDEF domain-containing protein